jgi:hypothetical protein
MKAYQAASSSHERLQWQGHGLPGGDLLTCWEHVPRCVVIQSWEHALGWGDLGADVHLRVCGLMWMVVTLQGMLGGTRLGAGPLPWRRQKAKPPSHPSLPRLGYST